MSRGPVHLLLACALLSLIASGCSSPWPPEGGEKPGAFPERVAQPVPARDNETLLDYVREVAISLEGRELELPGQSQAVCVQALKRAADDDLDGLRALLAPVAAFGVVPRSNLPPYDRDPRRFEPLDAHDHTELLVRRLQRTGNAMASQRNGTTAIGCGREFPSVQDFVTRGAEPIWCSYKDASNFEWINFTLVTTADGPRISYIATTPATPRSFPSPQVWPPATTTIPMLPSTQPGRGAARGPGRAPGRVPGRDMRR